MAYVEDTLIDGQVYDYRDKKAVHNDEVLNKVYPVGAIYLSTVNTDPSVLFGGTWTRIEDLFLLAGGSKWQPGSTGGYADAQLPQHKHTATGSSGSSGGHTHTINSNGAHTHDLGGKIWSNGAGSATAYTMVSNRVVKNRATGSAGSHTHSMATAGAHTHPINVSVAASGVDATDRNLPPYLSVYVWVRES